ncbi:hypothetical protein I3843_04G123700 [Carya illinoinensis]|uniref:Uncharacterized protein ycf68 n=1 Tax=Carya illinoinensis TaxID=32201 RepID=A0A922F9V4_CARIL|nr:hypothetical protein I3760_04G132900 [Carya illinoinensis]KAG6718063.1 hypothetical protein I3842_04G133000 [Carya illinoinensis]KAG6718064.1 hypothetical protein I3842_04G133000 [Carya illinoinensis]KAG7983773.1 hypothetical protein I3843_04G123700 [Carya illinoinensis]KAG7983774.1 hypothetical protein I3843_04G123700 [Carya illinoinensis]
MGNSSQIQCRFDFLFTYGDLGSSGGPPLVLSSQESIHSLSVYGQLSLEQWLRFDLNGKIKRST